MKIKASLAVLSGSFVILILSIAGITLHAFSNINRETRKQNAVNEAVENILELNILTTEYLMHPVSRAEKQWTQKYDSLGGVFDRLKGDATHEENLSALDAIFSDYKALGGHFVQLQANSEKRKKLVEGAGPEGQVALSLELQESLATQALMRTLRMTSEVIVLSGMAEQRIALVQERVKSILAYSIIGFAIFSAAVSLATGRAIVNPIEELIRGAGIIGEGNLQHRISIGSEGEVGELAAAFNQMAEKRGRAEEEIQALNRDLEGKVLERTAQLDAANKELEAFAYSVSHDLRAPLRSMDGFSQAVIEDYGAGLDEPGRDYLRRIREASQKMASLIDDLLTLSRITRSEMRPQAVDLSGIAVEITRNLQQENPEREAELAVREGIAVAGDEKLLRIAMENLLRNAWKFTEKTPRAVIEFGTVEHGDGMAYFVRDNGVGFDMAYASKLFVPFQRLHSAEDFKGTGIGLATVQRIIRRHGGEVWADGHPGRGAVFYFTLPSGVEGQ